MREYIELGPVPAEEFCEQAGPDCDYDKMRAECARYIETIRKKIGPEPAGAKLSVKGFSHDFGTYYEAVCYYDETEQAIEYAFRCESDAPSTWDEVLA